MHHPRSARCAARIGSPAPAPGSRTRPRSARQARRPHAAADPRRPTSARPPAACAAQNAQACPAGEHGERSSNARSRSPQHDPRFEEHSPASRPDDTTPRRRTGGRRSDSCEAEIAFGARQAGGYHTARDARRRTVLVLLLAWLREIVNGCFQGILDRPVKRMVDVMPASRRLIPDRLNCNDPHKRVKLFPGRSRPSRPAVAAAGAFAVAATSRCD